MSNENKKQIVFIEPNPTVIVYRIARSLKLTGKYETVLFSFSDLNREFYSEAYDKIFVLDLSHKLNFIKLSGSLRKIFNKEGKKFFDEMRKMRPYLFQITGVDFFSLIALFFCKKSPKIYYANDIWGSDKRNFFLTKEFWIKGEIQKLFEKICFKKVNGVINKKSLEEFKLLDYSVNVPKISIPPSCLDEWTFQPIKKNKKEIHLVFGASPPHSLGMNEISFIDILKILKPQRIHLHTYSPCMDEKKNLIYIEESKNNKYYHYHEKVKPNQLNKEMSKYDYGIFLYFINPSKTNVFPEAERGFIGAKMINYIEAGLPIILNSEYKSMAELVEKNNIGLAINSEDLKNLRQILEKVDYKKFQRNIKKYQEKFKMSKRIKEIELFYHNIANMER